MLLHLLHLRCVVGSNRAVLLSTLLHWACVDQKNVHLSKKTDRFKTNFDCKTAFITTRVYIKKVFKFKACNSTYPSDFSIRTNSIKKFSGRITSISVPKSVKRCSVRSSANFTHARITNRSSKARNPPSMRTHFAAVSAVQFHWKHALSS